MDSGRPNFEVHASIPPSPKEKLPAPTAPAWAAPHVSSLPQKLILIQCLVWEIGVPAGGMIQEEQRDGMLK